MPELNNQSDLNSESSNDLLKSSSDLSELSNNLSESSNNLDISNPTDYTKLKSQSLNLAYEVVNNALALCNSNIKDNKANASLITGSVKSLLDLIKYQDSIQPVEDEDYDIEYDDDSFN